MCLKNYVRRLLLICTTYIFLAIINHWLYDRQIAPHTRRLRLRVFNLNRILLIDVKRAIDIVLALVALIVFSPLMLTIAIIIRLRLGAPVLFCQNRPGRHGKLFVIYKFRTMHILHDTDGNLLPDEERITTFGHFLRSTSLDELPEFFNVLHGDMSLVGPRPLLEQYLPLYTSRQARRHEVRPGITGWAQIHGRNMPTWEEKFEMDVWYVDNHNLWLDLKILALTPIKVLRREGISQVGYVTAEHFEGTTEVETEF